MDKYYIGLNLFEHRMEVFADNRGDGVALAESGYEFVSGPYPTSAEANEIVKSYKANGKAA